MVIACIIWYVIGVVAALVYFKYGAREEWARYISRRDLLVALTVGGISGLGATVLMIRALVYTYDWWDEKIF